MKKKYIAIILTVVAVVGFWLYSTTQSQADSAAQPGSVDDPVVTKSYVDEQIRKLLNGGAPAATPTPVPTATPTPGVTPPAAATITVDNIKLEPNQTIYINAGADAVVRTGKVIAVSSDTNGIADVTAGKDILPGTSVETNHMLLFPRDGRGLKPDPKFKEEIYITIRGGYVIQ